MAADANLNTADPYSLMINACHVPNIAKVFELTEQMECSHDRHPFTQVEVPGDLHKGEKMRRTQFLW